MPIHGYPGNIITANPTEPSQTSASGVWTTEQQLQYQNAGKWPPPYYLISRSLRFNSADSAYLNRTPASAGNRKTWTWSCWAKLGTSPLNILSCNSANNDTGNFQLTFTSSAFAVQAWSVNWRVTTQVLRDNSAWYHIIVAVDTTQATANNRIRVYINGTEVTAFSTINNPSQNADIGMNQAATTRIGAASDTLANFFNGYLTEINFIDGQALTPSSFGQTNSQTGIWEPIRYTGTYGTNGFYLNFSDNSNTTAATLGKDYSGNGNNWTPNNFSVTAGAGDDSVVDTPTSYGTNTGVGGEVRGNYATRNPLAASTTATGYPTNGNLDSVWSSGGSFENATTIGFDATDATGYYWEYLVNGTALSKYPLVGIANNDAVIAFTGKSGGSAQPGTTSGGWMFENASGSKFNNNSVTSYGTATTSGWGCVAVKNGKIFIGSISGGTITWKNSGNPITEANPMFSGITGTVFPVTSEYSSGTVSYNFGQKPFQATAPSGFKALCTQNLPTPTIGATSTTQANDYFNAVLYTGNGSTQSITGVGFQPDWVWIKKRSGVESHNLFDVVRGSPSNFKTLQTNTTGAEITPGTTMLSSLDSDGFTLGSNGGVNESGYTFVGWNWKANGAGSTNTAGTITSTVSANTTSGFSIVTYTGTGANATVGHGLGVAPRMFITKNRDSGTPGWAVYHASVGNTGALALNATTAVDTNSVYFNNTTPTSTVFSVGTGTAVNTNTQKYVAYCFAAVAGYSAFGSYTGNGSTDGPFVYTGFRPRWVLFKQSSAAGEDWYLFDTSRSTYNATNTYLQPNTSGAEASSSARDFDILSNGFKLRNTNASMNANAATYIYAAFAENPFKYSLAR